MGEAPKFSTDDPITVLEAMAIAMAKRFMVIDSERGDACEEWRESVDAMSVDFAHLAEVAMVALVDWTRKAVAHADDLKCIRTPPDP